MKCTDLLIASSPKVQQFYTNRTLIDDFKNYIKVIMTHRNPYTNVDTLSLCIRHG